MYLYISIYLSNNPSIFLLVLIRQTINISRYNKPKTDQEKVIQGAASKRVSSAQYFNVQFNIFKYIPDSGLSRFFLGVYTALHSWTTTWQVEHQRCSRTGRVKKKSQHFKTKKHNI